MDVSMSHAPDEQALLVMAHGSRDAEAREEYRRIHRALAERMAPTAVVFAVLEFPGDDSLLSIEDAWRQCVESGARRIVGLPFFLFPAGHVREDLPHELREARKAGGWAELDLLPPLGAAEELLSAVEDRAREAAGPGAGATTALVLVGAGTSDPDANGDLCKAARLLWERTNGRYGLVETAWVSLTRPTVGEAVDRCVRLGSERIALVPYFLNTGVLLKRIDEQLTEIRPAHASVPITRAAHIGLHPRLLDLLERRAREGLERGSESTESMAVCGRPSCVSIAAGRDSLRRANALLR
jgi:sirohydrochlorin cobaltochelatase